MDMAARLCICIPMENNKYETPAKGRNLKDKKIYIYKEEIDRRFSSLLKTSILKTKEKSLDFFIIILLSSCVYTNGLERVGK